MDEGSHSLSSKHIKSVIKTVFAIAFIGIVFYEGKKGLSSIKISDVKTVLMYLTGNWPYPVTSLMQNNFHHLPKPCIVINTAIRNGFTAPACLPTC